MDSYWTKNKNVIHNFESFEESINHCIESDNGSMCGYYVLDDDNHLKMLTAYVKNGDVLEMDSNYLNFEPNENVIPMPNPKRVLDKFKKYLNQIE